MTANLTDLDDFERQLYSQHPPAESDEQRIHREAQAARDSGVCDEGETSDLIRREGE